MNILLTGATGYIAKRLLPVLLKNGHHVYACVRDRHRFGQQHPLLTVVEADFLVPTTLTEIPQNIDIAYYLIHSMSSGNSNFEILEAAAAENFVDFISRTSVKQVIYLSGIVNDEHLSRHLASRKKVEEILASGHYAITTLRAGIILGSGSASFEIMRDLVEKLPVMIAPRWLLTRSQPIAIRNVIEYLEGVLLLPSAMNKSFDIGGPEVMSYKEMLLRFAHIRGLNRKIWIVPVMTPRLSSYWLYFVTSTSYKLAVNLVNSMKVEVVAKPNNLTDDLNIKLLNFNEAILSAFEKIESNDVLSSWKDSMSSGILDNSLWTHLEVPSFGCFKDTQTVWVDNPELCLRKIWSIGGESGWYYANFLWKIRGIIDKIAGGVGLRRGRTNINEIMNGDALDFWRVLIADRKNRRLLLYAEMKLPGEAWLEFRIDNNQWLIQTATFRPKGILGRLYWYSMLPFHAFIFRGMAKQLANQNLKPN